MKKTTDERNDIVVPVAFCFVVKGRKGQTLASAETKVRKVIDSIDWERTFPEAKEVSNVGVYGSYFEEE